MFGSSVSSSAVVVVISVEQVVGIEEFSLELLKFCCLLQLQLVVDIELAAVCIEWHFVVECNCS